MKVTAQILLFVFITFLTTPTIVSVIKKSADISVFYNFSEEELTHKEIKAVFNLDLLNIPNILPQSISSLIHSENLSKHDSIASKIFIPPPEQV